MKPRILINCPGGWSHGLDSPERGEGRWAQNLAKVLARSGRYEVFASSGGAPTWGRGEVLPEVTLLAEPDANKLTFDVYIDSSWYQGKPALGTARAYLHAYWTPEDWMFRVPLPANHHILYVYRQMKGAYVAPYNLNPTLYLPAPFGPSMTSPNPDARRVLCFSRQRDAQCNISAFEALYFAVEQLRVRERIPFAYLDHATYGRHGNIDDTIITIPPGQPWGIPYCEQLALIRGAGVNVTFGGGGSIADCTVHGVPTLLRADAFDFVTPVARHFDLLLPQACSAMQILEAMRRLYGDRILYANYTRALQEVYEDHTDGNVLRLFDEIVERVL